MGLTVPYDITLRLDVRHAAHDARGVIAKRQPGPVVADMTESCTLLVGVSKTGLPVCWGLRQEMRTLHCG